ncbi:Tryptophan 2,3-dioxygenase [Porphyridium purpureum]|uniref:Tryptophan 2,3-dioxygenase n=1 Tax=Porphyridium purpureum TaxID=35688 RepID=A0A5J4YQH6_PORPP|nr:Tryptophan 2,3-dioxygenase [Porphyridium purpureum]|eukprot:POR2003..scf222_8
MAGCPVMGGGAAYVPGMMSVLHAPHGVAAAGARQPLEAPPPPRRADPVGGALVRGGAGVEPHVDAALSVLPAVSERSSASIRSAREPLYYGDYLQLDKLTTAQAPVSARCGDLQHDEMLFITIHQTYEIWFKQVLYELDSVRAIFTDLKIGANEIATALHRLQRIVEILKILVDQIRVLETMTPQQFLNFRDYLFPASGFQSYQFRLIEIKLGVQRDAVQQERFMSALSAEHRALVEAALQEPSLFDYVERWLRNMPFREFRGYNFMESYKITTNRMLELDRTAIEAQFFGKECESMITELQKNERMFRSVYDREVHEELRAQGLRRFGFRATCSALFIMLYEEEPMLHLPARLLRSLIDIDDAVNQWRYRHTQMVHKMIGTKVGTGGSLGFSYLRSTVDNLKVFTDLSNMSTLLIPSRLLPSLPAMIRDQCKFFHSVEPYDRTLFELGGGGDTLLDWSFC